MEIAAKEAQLAESKRQHRAFVSARLVLVLLFIGLWLILLPVGYPMPYGFLIVLLAEALTLRVFLSSVGRLSRAKSLDRMHYLLLLSELGFHTAIVYFLGGVSWLGLIAYLYALMYAAVFLPWRQAAVFAGAVGASFMAVISLDGAGIIPHQWYLPQGPDRFRDPEFLVTTSVAFAGVLVTVTFWMVFIGNEVRRERDVALRANAQLMKAQKELRQLNEELERKVEERTRALAWRAEHDQLTGLLNRGSISRRCHELLLLARRGNRPLTVIVADGDNFKSCNDRGGHEYGDEVLQVLSESLRESCRESDMVGRIGGDEFLIILPDTSVRGALRFCRRVLRQVADRRQAWGTNGLPMPSLSLGVAVFPEHGAAVEELIRVADHAMYDAKAAGGGCAKLAAGAAASSRGRKLAVGES